MISVLLCFCYIFLTTFIVGSFILRRIYAFLKLERKVSLASGVVTGIIVVTVYAGYFSIFYKVGLVANLILAAACVAAALMDRKEYSALIKETGAKLKWYQIVLYVLVAAACAFFAANGDFAYDTGLYHAQSIHWIEDYGVVKGISNMSERLGYNSSYFCFAALYSMKFLLGQSLHVTSGFMVTFGIFFSLGGFFNREKKWMNGGNICRLGILIYSAIIAMEFISPTTDYISVILVMWLVSCWADLCVDEEKEIAPYALLCVAGAFLISLKLAAAVIVLLVVKPAVSLIRQKKWKHIFFYIGLGILVVMPYFIRNVIISGWLIYPFAAIDIFPVEWKIPVDTVIGDATDVRLWARYVYDRNLIDQSVAEWFPTWWSSQGAFNQGMTLWAFVSIGIGFLYVLGTIWSKIKKKDTRWFGFAYLSGILLVNIIYWFFFAPMHRYGYAFIIILPLAIAAMIAEDQEKGRMVPFVRIALAGVILLYVLKPMYPVVKDDLRFVRDRFASGEKIYVGMQKDYPKGEMDSAMNKGIQIYYPVTPGGQSWYESFPATNYGENMIYWEPMGTEIKDGFRHIPEDK